MIVFDFSLTNYVLDSFSVISDDFKYIDMVFVQNTGAAFSAFKHATVLLIIISFFAMLYIAWRILSAKRKYSLMFCFFLSMLTAGIFCNTFERITLGYVRDFICFKCFNFPVFNISDILINLGVIGIMYFIVTKKYLENDRL